MGNAGGDNNYNNNVGRALGGNVHDTNTDQKSQDENKNNNNNNNDHDIIHDHSASTDGNSISATEVVLPEGMGMGAAKYAMEAMRAQATETERGVRIATPRDINTQNTQNTQERKEGEESGGPNSGPAEGGKEGENINSSSSSSSSNLLKNGNNNLSDRAFVDNARGNNGHGHGGEGEGEDVLLDQGGDEPRVRLAGDVMNMNMHINMNTNTNMTENMNMTEAVVSAKSMGDERWRIIVDQIEAIDLYHKVSSSKDNLLGCSPCVHIWMGGLPVGKTSRQNYSESIARYDETISFDTSSAIYGEALIERFKNKNSLSDSKKSQKNIKNIKNILKVEVFDKGMY